ncbi:porin [Thalassotalea litorea]|uniref:Porin n=1 Tax=Thalassotalea litorea TaxID=2020715 RepID=A0A5R9IPN9_9GAMM|nr:porin [Thalassotalea litorea]TLU65231.1 porin [Thalassotalea litorea]
MKRTVVASALLAALFSQQSFANEQTEELRNIIAEQQQTLTELERRLDETEQRLEATADAVEESDADNSAVTIGGYGELHYNNLKDNDSGSSKKEIDFHRFVLFFGTEFTSKTRFFSEFELEHSLAGDGKNGEVELEQAYVEHDISDTVSGKVGLFLIPVGLLNETHEPPTFYGVERNPVEKNILPTTWWEAGAGLSYAPAGGWAIDTAIHSGLDISSKGSYKPRDGRQKVSEAAAEDLAFTGRVKYTGINGLELAATYQYQQDITQGGMLADGSVVDTASANMLSAHAVYQLNQFTLKALYAQWNIDGAEAQALGRDKQDGFYIEPSYRINDAFGVFARYNVWDNNAGDNNDTEVKQTNVGVSYYLHENVVLKADYETQSGANDVDGFNLGFGYYF